MLKGFVITPVQLGRIAMGEIIEHKGKQLPAKLDHFKVTSLVQDGHDWRDSPVAAKLNSSGENGAAKLRSIPVRIMFDRPSNNFRAEFTAFDQKGRPLCSGDGEKARRRAQSGEEGGSAIKDLECPGPDLCQFGQENRCKLYARLIVSIDVDGAFEKNPLAGYVLRTTSFNTVRSISASLSQWSSLGDGMAGFPANLIMRAKSTASSMRKPIFYAELEPRTSLFESVKACSAYRDLEKEAGVCREKLEAAIAAGYDASNFIEDSDDGAEIVAEFYSDLAEIDLCGAAGDAGARKGDAPPDQSTFFGDENQANETINSLKSMTDVNRINQVITSVNQFYQGDLAEKVVEAAKVRLSELDLAHAA